MLTTSTFFSSFCLISLVYFLSCFLSHLHPFIFLLPFFPFSRSFTPFSFFFPSPVSPFLFLSPPSFRISSFPFPYPPFHYFPFSPLPLSPLSFFTPPSRCEWAKETPALGGDGNRYLRFLRFLPIIDWYSNLGCITAFTSVCYYSAWLPTSRTF